MTGIPACEILRIVDAISAPPSSFTPFIPPSFTIRIAEVRAFSGVVSYEPIGRSAIYRDCEMMHFGGVGWGVCSMYSGWGMICMYACMHACAQYSL